MKTLPKSLLLVSALALAMPAAKSQTSSRASGAPLATTNAEAQVALVNGKAVSRGAFELALQEQLRMGAQDSSALREAVRQDLVIRLVLVDLAEKARLESKPAVGQRLAAARQGLLAQAWQQQWLVDNPPADDEIQAEYAAMKERAGNKEVQIRQVVVRDETAARLVIDQLSAGKSMAEMAKAYSIEPLGKDDGGLMPWVTPSSLVAPLGDSLVKARVGQRLQDPVRSANGFHILELVAERPFVLPPLEQMRPQLAQLVAQRKLAAAIQEQVNRAKIEFR